MTTVVAPVEVVTASITINNNNAAPTIALASVDSNNSIGATVPGFPAVTNITDLTSSVTISHSYTGSETLEYCSSSVPFQSIDCVIGADITITRQALSDIIGTSGTASFSISAGKSGYNSKVSNSLTVTKHTITQLSYTNDLGSSDEIDNVAEYNGALYFSAAKHDANNAITKLYKYDGTNITQISDTVPGSTDDVSSLMVFNGELYFSCTNSDGDNVLCKYNDTTNKITQFSGFIWPYPLTVFNDTLYVVAYPDRDSYQKLYKYDPNANTLTQVSNINSDDGDYVDQLTVYNGALYFIAVPTASIMGIPFLFKYDDNTHTVTQVSDMNGGSGDDPSYLTVFNGELYFSADKGNSDRHKLYKYNDVTDTITQVSNINNGKDDGPVSMTVVNSVLYFTANSDPDNHYRKLYKYDGNTITQVSNIRDGKTDAPSGLIAYNDTLYFGIYSYPSTHDNKFYKYDDITNTITQVSNINDGEDDDASGVIVFNDAIYLYAKDHNGHTSLYKYE